MISTAYLRPATVIGFWAKCLVKELITNWSAAPNAASAPVAGVR